jgi:5-methylcytosine-specific restriction endonuclease McrA
MARKGPTDAQRVALWRAYDLICPYCGKPIDSYFQLEIDHIIPQSLLDDTQRLKELLIRLGIPDLDLIRTAIGYLFMGGHATVTSHPRFNPIPPC